MQLTTELNQSQNVQGCSFIVGKLKLRFTNGIHLFS